MLCKYLVALSTVLAFTGSAVGQKAQYGSAPEAKAMLERVVAGIKTVLKPTGVCAFEDPYLGDVVEMTSYDQIYDEHVFLFSLSSISYAFGLSGHQPYLPPNWSGGDQLAIHGTDDPASIGTAASHGCLRVSPQALARLRPALHLGTPVVIMPTADRAMVVARASAWPRSPSLA